MTEDIKDRANTSSIEDVLGIFPGVPTATEKET